MRTRLAWLLVGISGVCAVADTVVVSAFQPLLSEATIAVHGWPLVNLAAQLGATPGQAYAFVFALEAAGSVISLLFLARVGVQTFQREVASFNTAAAQTMD